MTIDGPGPSVRSPEQPSAAHDPTGSMTGSDAADVVVVGGGVSGLVCARDLHDAGLTVVVLEASHRLGGRVLTQHTPGAEPVELGAQWVADSHHQLQALLTRHGLRLRRPPRHGRVVHLDDAGRRTLPAWRAPFASLTLLQSLDFLVATARLSLRTRQHPKDADIHISAAQWLDGACRTAAGRQLLGSSLEASACLPATDISLAWVLDEFRRCGGLSRLSDTEQQVVVGGLGALVDCLAAPLDIRLDQSANRLRRTGAQWQIDTANAALACDHVVVATAPAATETLLPSAGDPQRKPGAVLKVVARYPRPFWRDSGRSGTATNVRTAAVVTGTVDAGDADPGSDGHLIGFVTGRSAQRLAGRPAAEQRSAVLDDLVRLHGPAAREPLHLVVHDWSQETWSPGGYTWPAPPGAALSRRRVQGVQLAGSEHADRWPGFVEGAVQAGHAAAAVIADIGNSPPASW